MLTASQIDAIKDIATQLLDPVIDFLIDDIARRVSEAGQLTATASYQIWRAQKLGMSQKQIMKEIQKRLKIPMVEVEQLLIQAAKTGYNFDLSRFPNKRAVPFAANSSIQQIVNAAVKLAQEDLSNIVQTIGFVCPDGKVHGLTKAYHKACDFAFSKVVTGAQDFHSALRDATRGLAEKGILSIDYESGVHTSLEAAVRRNIMGGLGLMQEQISQQNHDDLGCDGWEISAHSGSAPDHEPIQGKQYPDKVYKRLNNSLKRRIGTLNCGHAASPIIMGISEPQYTPEELERFRQENEAGVTVDGKHYTKYEATQHQRGLERAARKQKRRILIDEAAGDTENLQQDQIKLVRIRQEYKRFSDAAGLRMQHERMDTAGFTWKHGKVADRFARPIVEFDIDHLAKDRSELLPGYKSAVIPDEKLTGYALNKDHPVGKNKALVFEKVLGYNISNRGELIGSVHGGLEKYRSIEREPTQYGRPFEVSMMIRGANGRYAPVVTAWQIDNGNDTPRLVSIYVDE